MKSIHDLLPKTCLFEYRISEDGRELTIGIKDYRSRRGCLMDSERLIVQVKEDLTPSLMERFMSSYIAVLIDNGVIDKPIIEEKKMDAQTNQLAPDFYQKSLEDLLCIIHRDGGHYIGEHGIEKAVMDAKIRAAAAVQSLDGCRCEAKYPEGDERCRSLDPSLK